MLEAEVQDTFAEFQKAHLEDSVCPRASSRYDMALTLEMRRS